MKRAKLFLGCAFGVVVHFTPVVVLGAFLLALMAEDRQEQAEWQQSEPQDRADFERVFQMPANILRTGQAGYVDVEDQAFQIRRAKVAHILLGEAQQILSLEQELHRLERTDGGSSYQEQVAQAASEKKMLDEAMKKFATDVRLARRFDYTGLYDDIDGQFQHGLMMSGDFCFIVDRLKNQDLSGFPFRGTVSPPPGCSE